MSQKKNFVKKQGGTYRSFVAAALVANGVFQFIAPVLAEGTAAGETISNTATVTYDDDDDPNTPPISATSNTVTVTVAEVAGITVEGVEISFKDGGDANNDGKYNVGDELYFIYDVTNVGNDPTKFKIGGEPTVIGPGTIPPGETLEISYDNGTTWETIDPTNGLETNSVVPDGVVKVRVPIKVNDDANAGEQISVKLGDTPDDAQNQPYAQGPDANGNKDVFTVDNPDGVDGETPGVLPETEAREASATQTITVDAADKSYALAKILKTNSNYKQAGNNGPIGDTLEYDLSLEVLSNDPTQSGINPAALQGTDINIDGTTSKNILVSDAIPAGTKLANVNAPPGWSIVYNTIDAANGRQATWSATVPSDLATVKRIGFIRTGEIIAGSAPVTGFKITVEVTSTANSLTIANVAQLFGESPNGRDVYDESGDAQPSNYDEATKRFPGTTQEGDIPGEIADNDIDDGFIDPTDNDGNGIPDELEGDNGYGTDLNNDNTGSGSGGEANVYKINTAAATSLLNGPENAPDAEVDGDNNKDFTNKSAALPEAIAPGGTVPNPGTVSFTNTLQNTGNSDADIVLEPKVPEVPTDLPPGTKVIITYNNNGTEEKAEYSYNSGAFTLDTSTRVDNPTDKNPLPIKILAVASNDTRNYKVDVVLPADTPLSTNDGVGGYPVPIRAFVDNDNDGTADTVDHDNNPGTPEVAAENVTIDRVYLGYLKLVKTSRILDSGGKPKLPTDGSFDDTEKSLAPGEIIEYQIRYENISEQPDANSAGNVILNAQNFVIVEDGTTDGNNWALDNDGDGELDTINVPATAKVVDEADNDATDATIAYDPADDLTTTKYTVTAVEVAPGVIRRFTFQRRVNNNSSSGG